MSLLDTAIEVAARAHRDQLRKGTDVPYITHPYGVGLMLARAGYDEEVIAAGILHDTVEDTDVTPEQVRETFGARVADIVRGRSEQDKDLPWESAVGSPQASHDRAACHGIHRGSGGDLCGQAAQRPLDPGRPPGGS